MTTKNDPQIEAAIIQAAATLTAEYLRQKAVNSQVENVVFTHNATGNIVRIDTDKVFHTTELEAELKKNILHLRNAYASSKQ